MIISDVNGLRGACDSGLQANGAKPLISVRRGNVMWELTHYESYDEDRRKILENLADKYFKQFKRKSSEVREKLAVYLLLHRRRWDSLKSSIDIETKRNPATQQQALNAIKSNISSIVSSLDFKNFDEKSALEGYAVSHAILSLLCSSDVNIMRNFATTSLKRLESIASDNITSAHGLSIKDAREPAHFTFEGVDDDLLIVCSQAVNFINTKDINQAAPLTIPGFAKSSIKIDLEQFKDSKENYLGEITGGPLVFYTDLAKNIDLGAAFISPDDDSHNEDSRLDFNFDARSSGKYDSAQQREDSRLWAILLQAKRVSELEPGSLRKCINYYYLRDLTQNYANESQYTPDSQKPIYMVEQYFKKSDYSILYRMIGKSYVMISNMFSAIWNVVTSIFNAVGKVLSFITYPVRALFSSLWNLPCLSGQTKPARSGSFEQCTELKKESSSFVASAFNNLFRI